MDPVESAITTEHSIQELAWEDFNYFCGVRDPDGDMGLSDLVDWYNDDCLDGSWVPHAWREETTKL